jgi:ferredoxin
VQVCPTGIDIRKGLQYECIGCAACIDGCNQVMDRMGYPRGLIRYTTENALAAGEGAGAAAMWKRVLRPRTAVYGAVLLVIIAVAIGSLAVRNPLKVDIIRDRGALAREAAPRPDRERLSRAAHEYRRGAAALRAARIGPARPRDRRRRAACRCWCGVDAPGRAAPAGADRALADGRTVAPGAHKIELTVEAVDDEKVVRHEQSTFIVPR